MLRSFSQTDEIICDGTSNAETAPTHTAFGKRRKSLEVEDEVTVDELAVVVEEKEENPCVDDDVANYQCFGSR